MELNPADYYRIDWDALNQLADADKMAALATIFERVRADIGSERGRMVHQAHASHGTKKAAADHLGLSPARFGQIYNESKEKSMTITTEYGTWNNHGDRTALTVEDTVAGYLANGDTEWAERCEKTGALEDMVSAYRIAINYALPDGVTLAGDNFYGPYYESDQSWESELDIAEIIQGIDLGEIVADHDPDNA